MFVDSIGSHVFSTDANGTEPTMAIPTADTVNYKEGISSLFMDSYDFDASGLEILDANLNAGFPLKNGDTNKKISVCFWIKPDRFSLWDGWYKTYFSKGEDFDNDKRSFEVGVFNSSGTHYPAIRVSSNGTIYTVYLHGTALALNTWYHFAATYEVGAYRLRIWDDTAGAILGNDATGVAIEAFVGTGPLWIGIPTIVQRTLSGRLDELVVFDSVISVETIDAIRNGTYGT